MESVSTSPARISLLLLLETISIADFDNNSLVMLGNRGVQIHTPVFSYNKVIREVKCTLSNNQISLFSSTLLYNIIDSSKKKLYYIID